MKKIIVSVIPSCISESREYQYQMEIESQYKSGKLTNRAVITEETDEYVKIDFYR